MDDPLERNVYKSANISHPSYLVSFASYFCESAGFALPCRCPILRIPRLAVDVNHEVKLLPVMLVL